MGGMLVHQRQRRITEKKFRHDQQSDVFFTIKGLLEDVASVTISRKFDYSASMRVCPLVREKRRNTWSNKPHATHDLTPFFGSRSGF